MFLNSSDSERFVRLFTDSLSSTKPGSLAVEVEVSFLRLPCFCLFVPLYVNFLVCLALKMNPWRNLRSSKKSSELFLVVEPLISLRSMLYNLLYCLLFCPFCVLESAEQSVETADLTLQASGEQSWQLCLRLYTAFCKSYKPYLLEKEERKQDLYCIFFFFFLMLNNKNELKICSLVRLVFKVMRWPDGGATHLAEPLLLRILSAHEIHIAASRHVI